jgi:hypothetical protein
MMKLGPYAGRRVPRHSDRHVGGAGTTDAGAGVAAGSDEGADGERYRLISIAAVRAPEGCVGRDWHVYRIVQGENGITGYRRGDLSHVRTDVEAIVTALNERRQRTKSKATSKR